MAKTPKLKVEEEEQDDQDSCLSPQAQMGEYMRHKDNVGDHFNFVPDKYYRVSTGSLKLDIITGGGITPGIVRLVGRNSGGKTSETLELMRNFLLVPNRRGIFFPAEGKFSEELKARSGVKFTKDPAKWDEGVCLIYETNIFEAVAKLMGTLIKKNPTNQEYMFAIDSLDGLILRDDLDKPFEDSHKVAGPQVVGKKLMQKFALPLIKFGHILIFTSQVTAQPKIDPYAKLEYRDFSSSGGNWALHYPEHIWEYTTRYPKAHSILEKPSEKPDEKKNPTIGHLAPVTIQKSNIEKKGQTLSYPIKYGRTNGTSVWVEREVGDVLIAYQMKVSGSWLSFPDSLHAEITKIDPDCPTKIQGSDKLYSYLESQPKVSKMLFQKFVELLIPCPQNVTDGSDPLADPHGDE